MDLFIGKLVIVAKRADFHLNIIVTGNRNFEFLQAK